MKVSPIAPSYYLTNSEIFSRENDNVCAKKDEISHHLQSDRSGERLMTCWFGRKFDDVMLSNILPHHYDIRYHGTTCYMSHVHAHVTMSSMVETWT